MPILLCSNLLSLMKNRNLTVNKKNLGHISFLQNGWSAKSYYMHLKHCWNNYIQEASCILAGCNLKIAHMLKVAWRQFSDDVIERGKMKFWNSFVDFLHIIRWSWSGMFAAMDIWIVIATRYQTQST